MSEEKTVPVYFGVGPVRVRVGIAKDIGDGMIEVAMDDVPAMMTSISGMKGGTSFVFRLEDATSFPEPIGEAVEIRIIPQKMGFENRETEWECTGCAVTILNSDIDRHISAKHYDDLVTINTRHGSS